jgi:hypothetical protein
MRIAFLDTTYQYTTDTPYKSPLGGSQSALWYLAVEWTRLGHAITIEAAAAYVRIWHSVETREGAANIESIAQAPSEDAFRRL